MSGHHHHHAGAETGDKRVLLALVVNLALTLAQIVAGIVSGSLAMIADALHNFSDAASLGIAFAARRIARRPSDSAMTFGYVRAEIVAALINYTTLIVVGLYLVYEAIMRLIDPSPVAGWIVVIVAGIALIVDLATVALTYALSKHSMNIRAAFLHNLADALGSVGVIVAGILIILFDLTIIDPIITLAIAGYILWQAFSEIGGSIRMLMLGSPPEIDADHLIRTLSAQPGVLNVHHLHIWMIDERTNALEAHIVIDNEEAAIKARIKALLADQFGIAHSTIELETPQTACAEADRQTVGHPVPSAS